MGYRQRHSIPDLGVGVGFRLPHYGTVLDERPPMDWFEVISENFMVRGGKALTNLDRLLAHYRVVPHGVSLSIGSVAPLNARYLALLKNLLRRVDAPWCSDHLCWTGTASANLHDLLPLPQTKETAHYVADRVRQVQDTLEVPFALENVSSYMEYSDSNMPEWEFLSEVAEKADCGLLFDCNNVFVSANNHGFDARTYVDAIDPDRVVQIHVAGHTDKGSYLLDTHSDHVAPAVWELYRRTLRRTGLVATLVEWDEDIPSWDALAAEAQMARGVREEIVCERAA